MSCLFSVTVAVVQQSVREVGSCSLDVKVSGAVGCKGAVGGGGSD